VRCSCAFHAGGHSGQPGCPGCCHERCRDKRPGERRDRMWPTVAHRPRVCKGTETGDRQDATGSRGGLNGQEFDSSVFRVVLRLIEMGGRTWSDEARAALARRDPAFLVAPPAKARTSKRTDRGRGHDAAARDARRRRPARPLRRLPRPDGARDRFRLGPRRFAETSSERPVVVEGHSIGHAGPQRVTSISDLEHPCEKYGRANSSDSRADP
jgi:hypothetical protein